MRGCYFRDPFQTYVHVGLRGTNLARCGSVVGDATDVIGARVCLGCVEVELEQELRRVQDQLRRYGKGGPPTR